LSHSYIAGRFAFQVLREHLKGDIVGILFFIVFYCIVLALVIAKMLQMVWEATSSVADILG
jgi:hypothetical protein